MAGAGVLPLEVMLIVMRRHYDAGRYDEAVEVAAFAAPYVHPKLAAVQLTGGETPMKLEIVEEIIWVDPPAEQIAAAAAQNGQRQ